MMDPRVIRDHLDHLELWALLAHLEIEAWREKPSMETRVHLEQMALTGLLENLATEVRLVMLDQKAILAEGGRSLAHLEKMAEGAILDHLACQEWTGLMARKVTRDSLAMTATFVLMAKRACQGRLESMAEMVIQVK